MSGEQEINMDIQINSKVFYPSHGAGEVVKEKKIEFAGEIKKYYEFAFINKKLTISTPINNIDKLGIRPVLDYKDLVDRISILKKKPSIKADVKDYNALMEKIEELDLQGEVDSFIKIIQYCHGEIDKREEEGRLIPVSITKNLKTSKSNLIGEMAVSKGMDYDKAEEEFKKITGLEIE